MTLCHARLIQGEKMHLAPGGTRQLAWVRQGWRGWLRGRRSRESQQEPELKHWAKALMSMDIFILWLYFPSSEIISLQHY